MMNGRLLSTILFSLFFYFCTHCWGMIFVTFFPFTSLFFIVFSFLHLLTSIFYTALFLYMFFPYCISFNFHCSSLFSSISHFSSIWSFHLLWFTFSLLIFHLSWKSSTVPQTRLPRVSCLRISFDNDDDVVVSLLFLSFHLSSYSLELQSFSVFHIFLADGLCCECLGPQSWDLLS